MTTNLPTTIEELAVFEALPVAERNCSDETIDASAPDFNWITVLAMLCNGADISNADKEKLYDLSSRWPKCACGTLCSKLPMIGRHGVPADLTLRQYGINFCDQICGGEWDNAIETFKQIEARTTELLKLSASDSGAKTGTAPTGK